MFEMFVCFLTDHSSLYSQPGEANIYMDIFVVDTVTIIESRSRFGCGPLTHWAGYVPVTTRSVVQPSTGGVGSCGSAVWGGIVYAFTVVWNVLATVLHIFGVYEMLMSAVRGCGSLFARVRSLFGSFSYQPLATTDGSDGGETEGTLELQTAHAANAGPASSSSTVYAV
jgi:hypothetical protein